MNPFYARRRRTSTIAMALCVGATIFGKNQINSLPADQQAILRETATQFHQLLIQRHELIPQKFLYPMRLLRCDWV